MWLAATSFFITRVLLYSIGLYDLCTQLADNAIFSAAFDSHGMFVQHMVWLVVLLLGLGFVLNLVWFRQIMKIALGKTTKAQ